MAEATFFAAFFAGLLSLFSPCSALLLPAFFAYAFGSGTELVGRTAVLYLGLCTTLVPLGMGISAVSRLFYGERETMILVAGAVVIVLGVVQILAGGRLPSGPLGRLRSFAPRGDSVGAVYVLGMVYGLAGFCSGPVLGAVLTVAAFSGEPLRGALLLALYALGMAAPLFILALAWDRFGLSDRRWLRGRELEIGPLRVHTTNLVSGLMFIVLGAVFVFYEGTSSLEGFYERTGAAGLASAIEGSLGALPRGVADLFALALLVLLAAAMLVRRVVRRRAGRKNGPDAETKPGR